MVCVVGILASWQLGVLHKRAMGAKTEDRLRDKRNLAALVTIER